MQLDLDTGVPEVNCIYRKWLRFSVIFWNNLCNQAFHEMANICSYFMKRLKLKGFLKFKLPIADFNKIVKFTDQEFVY